MDNNNNISSPIHKVLLAASQYTRCCYNITRLLSLITAIIISKSLVALCAATPDQLDQQSSITNHHNYNHNNHILPLPAIPVPQALLSHQSRSPQQDHHQSFGDYKTYNILKGDNVTFECSLDHHEADHAVWMYQLDVQEVPMFLAAKKSTQQDFISTNQNKFSLISTGRLQKLTIHNVQPIDQGFYVCQIQNNAMRYNKPKSKFLLNVATKPTIEKIIEHIKTPQPINNEHTITNNEFAPVLEYDSKFDHEIGLSCLATSDPAPQYKWYKYQQPKIVDSQTDKQSGQSTEQLGGWREISLTEHINKISISDPIDDSTLYKCQANNSFGTAEHIIEVRIKAPPKIYGQKDGTDMHFALPHSSVVLTCRGRVYPDSSHIEKYWIKDNVRLDPSQNDDHRLAFDSRNIGDFFTPEQLNSKANELTSSEQHNNEDKDMERINQWRRMRSQQTDVIMTLKILSLKDTDFGNYSCHVSSRQNNAEDSHLFTLSGAPSQVKLVSPAISEHPDKYHLVWQVDTPQPVIKHIIYYRLANQQQRQQHQQDETGWTQIVLPLEHNHRVPSYNLALTSSSNVPTGTESIHESEQQQANKFEYTITNLTKETIYEVKVEAENKRGSIQSNVLQFATPDSSSISSYFHSAASRTVPQTFGQSQLLLIILMVTFMSIGRWL